MIHKYRSEDSLAELISGDYNLLQVMSRYGIALGFGEKTVDEVCRDNHVDTETFLAVCNFVSQGIRPSFEEYMTINVESLLTYLRSSHTFFLEFMLPNIRRKFVEAVDCSTHNEVGFLILKFFDDYVAEVKAHQQYESDHFFQYVEGLLHGRRPADVSLQHFEDDHNHIDHDKLLEQKMGDLKRIIIRYSPSSANKEMLNDALRYLCSFERDIIQHTQLEDALFIPVVSVLESQVDVSDNEDALEEEADKAFGHDILSQREKEIIMGVVKGQTNKEIADHLFISMHTVLTHRRNIARKLDIHTPAGLVIYAIVHGIVKVDDIKDLQIN